jgi:hypothetical protein
MKFPTTHQSDRIVEDVMAAPEAHMKLSDKPNRRSMASGDDDSKGDGLI